MQASQAGNQAKRLHAPSICLQGVQPLENQLNRQCNLNPYGGILKMFDKDQDSSITLVCSSSVNLHYILLLIHEGPCPYEVALCRLETCIFVMRLLHIGTVYFKRTQQQ